MDGTEFNSKPVPFFSVKVKNGVTTLTNRAPDQPSFLTSNDDAEGTAKADTPQTPECRSCNCRNSKCLKLYCECFAASLYCVGCNCNNCMNTPQYEKERQQAVQTIQQRNPDAFKTRQAGSKRESTSCRCKKSGCSKKYCECFQNNLSCSELCQCTDCQNPFKSGSKKTLSPIDRVRQQFDPSTIDPSIVNLTRSMITAAQRLSDQDAAHDLLTLSFISPSEAETAKRQRLADKASDADMVTDPPSPKTARLLCDEAPDMPGAVSDRGSSDLYKQQEIEILSRLDDYLKNFVLDSHSRQP